MRSTAASDGAGPPLEAGPRYDPLDWLRGLLALVVMGYHFFSWNSGPGDAQLLLGKLAIYAVAMFFVISGASMAIVYRGLIVGVRPAVGFLIRRAARIAPMLWIAIAGLCLITGLRPEPWTLLLNVTGAFGVLAPGSYINTGAWTVGNEIAYYLVTPFVLAAYDRDHRLGLSIVAAAGAAATWFAFVELDPAVPLASQWQIYIHPLNNFFFYCAGIALHYHLRGFAHARTLGVGFAGIALAGFAWTVHGDLGAIVAGPARVVYGVASVAAVGAVYCAGTYESLPLRRTLGWLGAATYGIYLLHPVMWELQALLVRSYGWSYGAGVAMLGVALATMVLAGQLYRWVERPAMRFGRRLAAPWMQA